MVKTFQKIEKKYKHCLLRHQYNELSSLTITVYLPEEDAVDGEMIRYDYDGVTLEWVIVMVGGYGHAVLEEK